MEEQKDLPVDKRYQVDWLLVGLIRDVEKREQDDKIPPSDKHIDMILTIGGMLVSGELVSHSRWINELQSDIDSESGDDLDAPASEAASSENVASVPDEESERRFIHLREAKFYSGGTVIPGEGDNIVD